MFYFIWRNCRMTLIIPERQRTKKKEKPLAGVYCKGGKPASPVAAHADSWGKSQLPKRIPWGRAFCSSLPGHSGGSPCPVQIRSSHFHQDWEGCTGDHSEVTHRFPKLPSGQQQPPAATADPVARAARGIQRNSDWGGMRISSGETLE